ncbi:MAG: twin-arginine translocation signal domain-containing protein, partial [Acidobacteriia bacterium]|nr:twin-arginine translocation signal domain-containing protein [Terriglobia bacterium]
MNRRDFLTTSAAALSASAISAQTRPRRPNVLMILADDLGYECLGC